MTASVETERRWKRREPITEIKFLPCVRRLCVESKHPRVYMAHGKITAAVPPVMPRFPIHLSGGRRILLQLQPVAKLHCIIFARLIREIMVL